MKKQHLYEAITAYLRGEIMDGRYAVGDMIPSENELAARFATSRVTVRKSLQILEDEELIRPRHGKGYFVQQPAQTRFTMYFNDAMPDVTVRYRKITVEVADDRVASLLDIGRERMVVLVHKALYRDDRPIAFDEKMVPYERGVPVVEREINYAEFPELFAERYVPATLWTDMHIAMERPPAFVAKELGLAPDAAVMVVTRYVKTSAGGCIGCAKRYITVDCEPIHAFSGFFADRQGERDDRLQG